VSVFTFCDKIVSIKILKRNLEFILQFDFFFLRFHVYLSYYKFTLNGLKLENILEFIIKNKYLNKNFIHIFNTLFFKNLIESNSVNIFENNVFQ
jgi:hypothetical protein